MNAMQQQAMDRAGETGELMLGRVEPSTPAPTMVDERASYIAWLGRSFPHVYDEKDAEIYWDKEHVSALAWKARATRPTLQSLGGDAGGSDGLVNDSFAADWLAGGAQLHSATVNLVVRFARAMAQKLAAAEKKYGYSDGWLSTDWMDECREKLIEHVAKGDPRDVAAYCAFLWHHGEKTGLTSTEKSDGWLPLSTAPEGVRVLLGPRESPVVGKVVHGDEERGSIASVVHYNGNTLVAGYRCSEWHSLPAALTAAAKSEGEDQQLINWVVARWHAEVASRPLGNVHRRSLDDTWRQVLRHLGVNDRARLGPTHDELAAEKSGGTAS